MRTQTDCSDAMRQYGDTVWRVCMIYMGQRADAEDAFQDTFVKYASREAAFESEEHRKAWLIRVASNVCKDLLKSSVHRTTPTDTFEEGKILFQEAEDQSSTSGLLEALMRLDEKYRVALYLIYYEGYQATEVSEMLKVPTNTVYTRVARGKKLLREVLTDEEG